MKATIILKMRIIAATLFSATLFSATLGAATLGDTCYAEEKSETPALIDIRKRGPISNELSHLFDNEHPFKCLELTGRIEDVFHDETNARYIFIVVRSGDRIFHATLRNSPKTESELQALIGAQAAFCGIVDPNSKNKRAQIGPTLYLLTPDDIRLLTPAPPNRFAVPEIGDLRHLPPQEIAAIGLRRAIGRVRAVWQGRSVLLETTNAVPLVLLDLADMNPPRIGDFIEAVGHLETDIYKINLSRAIWQPAFPGVEIAERPVQDVTAADILEAQSPAPGIRSELYGEMVRLEGKVLSEVDTNGRFLIQSGKHTVPIDASALDGRLAPIVGSIVRITGVCLMTIENWRPNAAFPSIQGVFVALRSPKDVTLVSLPSWWTPGRLFSVIGVLVLLLLAALIWNRMLVIAAARLGRKLMREELQRTKSELRVAERTRLAAELHDSLSQILTGISMEIEAARNPRQALPEDVRQNLDFAARALRFCRNDIRYHLWDLRNMSLDEPDMTKAVLKTLAPHVKGVKVAVRFNVARTKLSDDIAQALLKVIRELSVNAIRHGRATSLKVAGEFDADGLMCSIRDNGCGFDPEKAVGVNEGHFGLQGVRERIADLGGMVSIDSQRGTGTKVTIKIRSNNFSV